jgi:hypothetical protein
VVCSILNRLLIVNLRPATIRFLANIAAPRAAEVAAGAEESLVTLT